MSANVANMQFMPGDVIQDFEKPFIKSLRLSCKLLHCNCCFKRSLDLRRCAGCKIVKYCDSKCQKNDWKAAHSIECKLFANSQFTDTLTEGVLQVIRLLAFLKLHGDCAKKTFQLYDGSQWLIFLHIFFADAYIYYHLWNVIRCFDDLLDHAGELKLKPALEKAYKSLALKLAKSKLFSKSESKYDNLIHLAGIWQTNAFGISNEEGTKVIGRVLYVLCSSFDHSCRPNAFGVKDDSFRMQVLTTSCL